MDLGLTKGLRMRLRSLKLKVLSLTGTTLKPKTYKLQLKTVICERLQYWRLRAYCQIAPFL